MGKKKNTRKSFNCVLGIISAAGVLFTGALGMSLMAKPYVSLVNYNEEHSKSAYEKSYEKVLIKNGDLNLDGQITQTEERIFKKDLCKYLSDRGYILRQQEDEVYVVKNKEDGAIYGASKLIELTKDFRISQH